MSQVPVVLCVVLVAEHLLSSLFAGWRFPRWILRRIRWTTRAGRCRRLPRWTTRTTRWRVPEWRGRRRRLWVSSASAICLIVLANEMSLVAAAVVSATNHEASTDLQTALAWADSSGMVRQHTTTEIPNVRDIDSSRSANMSNGMYVCVCHIVTCSTESFCARLPSTTTSPSEFHSFRI